MDHPTCVYLDTNIFIAAFERKDALGLKIGRLFEMRGSADRKLFATSDLTLSELLVAPYRSGDAEIAHAYEALLTTNEWLSVLPVTRAVLKRAASIRSSSIGLKLPDAIHLATAVEAGATDLLTDDIALGKVQLPKPFTLDVIRPDEPTLNTLIERLSQ